MCTDKKSCALTSRRNLYVSNLDDKLFVVTACLRIALKHHEAILRERTHASVSTRASACAWWYTCIFSSNGLPWGRSRVPRNFTHGDPTVLYFTRDLERKLRCFFRGRTSHLGPYGFCFPSLFFSLPFSFSHCPFVGISRPPSPPSLFSSKFSHRWIISFRYI